eukprot:TRINITY_DN2199_c0_g1_i1.p1 TRINITY_DN2199_c0_g1~~TRINITY_DN2199_c0_g1_i1.p1  ORF type:complete len:469 (+),score=78.76 TRINITY_DN2199_c0_g1_i1:33-1409(+)
MDSSIFKSRKLLMVIFLISVMVKIFVSMHPYSGKGNQPELGDFEAQRHWLEITNGLDLDEWYKYSEDYWRLDYPPLTAYHSLFLGKFAKYIYPKMIEFEISRGIETKETILLMRLFSLISDLFIFSIPVYFLKFSLKSFFFLWPGLILIDHGHFQFNSCALGLTLMSISCLREDKFISSAILYCLALNFKQMCLYFAPVYFVYMLRKYCLIKSVKKIPNAIKIRNFVFIACSVLFTFLALWLPFTTSIPNIIQRIFPVWRGLYEDKVASFWCTISPLFKLRNTSWAVYLSMSFTCLAFLPSLIFIFAKPTFQMFLNGLVSSSLSFFLFSIQVHEKTILFVTFALILASKNSVSHKKFLFVQFSFEIFSMYHLLAFKDDLFWPTILIFLIVIYLAVRLYNFDVFMCSTFILQIVGIICAHTIAPPVQWLWLWPQLMTSVSFCWFFLLYLRCQYFMFCDL